MRLYLTPAPEHVLGQAAEDAQLCARAMADHMGLQVCDYHVKIITDMHVYMRLYLTPAPEHVLGQAAVEAAQLRARAMADHMGLQVCVWVKCTNSDAQTQNLRGLQELCCLLLHPLKLMSDTMQGDRHRAPQVRRLANALEDAAALNAQN